jgi:hypothetical protein
MEGHTQNRIDVINIKSCSGLIKVHMVNNFVLVKFGKVCHRLFPARRPPWTPTGPPGAELSTKRATNHCDAPPPLS